MRPGSGSAWRRAGAPRRCCPSPGLRAEADLAAHHVDHPLRDREAEAEALALERGRASVEPLEDAVLLFGGNPLACVLDLDRHGLLLPPRGAKGNRAGRRGVRAGVGEQADHHLAQQHRVALGDQIRLDLVERISTPSGASTASAASAAASVTSTTCGGIALARRLHPGQHEQRLGQPGHPLGVVGEPAEEAVAGLGVVLGAAAQHLDPAR